MAKPTSRIRFSLKTLLLLPLFVSVCLVWFAWQFSYQVASSTPAFDVTLAELSGQIDVEDQLEEWLTNRGYRRSQRPQMDVHQDGCRESWYYGERDGVGHSIIVRSDDSNLWVEVHFESETWFFGDTRLEDQQVSATDDVAHEMRAWWDQMRIDFVTAQPND